MVDVKSKASDSTSVRDFRLDESDVEIEGHGPIRAVQGEDGEAEEEMENYLGFTTFYTIGEEFEVPREWLISRMEELGLPVWLPGLGPDAKNPKEYMAPPKVTPKRAFNRVRKYLITPENDEDEIGGRTITFEMKKASTEAFHIMANAYFSADELDAEDGEWRQRTLGVCRYNKENASMLTVPKVEDGDPLFGAWEYFRDEAGEMFERMLESHIGKDIQKMMYKYTHYWTRSIKLRDGGAVYFVPRTHAASLDALKTLIDEINTEFKRRGKDASIRRIVTVGAKEEREMVEARAREYAHTEATDALSNAIGLYEERLEADEDTLVDELIDDLRDRLKDQMGFAEEYETLLDAEIAIEEIVDEWKNARNLEGEKRHIVEKALEEAEKGESHTA